MHHSVPNRELIATKYAEIQKCIGDEDYVKFLAKFAEEQGYTEDMDDDVSPDFYGVGSLLGHISSLFIDTAISPQRLFHEMVKCDRSLLKALSGVFYMEFRTK